MDRNTSPNLVPGQGSRTGASRQVYDYSDEFWANLFTKQSDLEPEQRLESGRLRLGDLSPSWTPLHSLAALLLLVTFEGQRAKKFVSAEMHHVLQPLPENTSVYSVRKAVKAPLQGAFEWFEGWAGGGVSPSDFRAAAQAHATLVNTLGEPFTRSLLPNLEYLAERVGGNPELNSVALEVVRPLAGSVDAEQQKVVVAFLSPSLEGLGARAESVIDLSDLERWKEMIRAEARMWDLPVRLLSEDQWRMPQLDSKADLYNPEFSTEIMGSMAVALDGMGVAPPVVQEFLRGGINVLYPPVSGRVILFQVIEAPVDQLGSLW